MSLLIKGLGMPKDCESCTVAHLADCELWMIAGYRQIHKDCPLVEVPAPHGPLVDADELKATFCAECNHTITCEDCDIDYHFGRLAPTIIEAEEGEKHD